MTVLGSDWYLTIINSFVNCKVLYFFNFSLIKFILIVHLEFF